MLFLKKSPQLLPAAQGKSVKYLDCIRAAYIPLEMQFTLLCYHILEYKVIDDTSDINSSSHSEWGQSRILKDNKDIENVTVTLDHV